MEKSPPPPYPTAGYEHSAASYAMPYTYPGQPVATPVYQANVQPGIQQSVTVVQAAPAPVIMQPMQPSVTVVQAGSTPAVIRTVQSTGPGTNPTVVMSPKDVPVQMNCPYCQQQVITVTKPIPGALTWILFATLFIFLLWPFCLVPFCVHSCNDMEHRCPACQRVLYLHRRM
ncbi:uncharacterized protein LOC143490896 [Brachyhypopomus gauderio]|uniref:uncharacterized protein LOC143490896 n=1 Tax=Brachyhypopomus gauderio TaxID=698409 RepID=UPI00404326AE